MPPDMQVSTDTGACTIPAHRLRMQSIWHLCGALGQPTRNKYGAHLGSKDCISIVPGGACMGGWLPIQLPALNQLGCGVPTGGGPGAFASFFFAAFLPSIGIQERRYMLVLAFP